MGPFAKAHDTVANKGGHGSSSARSSSAGSESQELSEEELLDSSLPFSNPISTSASSIGTFVSSESTSDGATERDDDGRPLSET